MAKNQKTKKKSVRRGIIAQIALLLGLSGFLLFAVTNGALFKGFALYPQCANSSCFKDLSGVYKPASEAKFLGKEVPVPSKITETTQANVLGATTGIKHIYVDLSNQRLYAYQGQAKIYDFVISSGKWHPTPTGDFHIWIKLRYTRMTGGEGADAYDLPDVPFTMFFYSDDVSKSLGYSIHGAYWHDNFGHPMSHGCVNLRPEDAEQLFNWATPETRGPTTLATDKDPGTEVTIYGKPPDY